MLTRDKATVNSIRRCNRVVSQELIIPKELSATIVAPALFIILANVNSRSRSLYAIARPSVVCLSSVTFVRPTEAVQIFGNISTALGTVAIH